MAKRFIDTNFFKKPLVRGMEGPYKLLYIYMFLDCDHAGIWIKDFEIAKIFLGNGIDIEEKKAIEIFGDKIHAFDNNQRWFIPSFIEHQYGKLNEKNRVHKSVIDALMKHGLYKKNKGLISSLLGAKDKDKDKAKEKDKEIYKEKEKEKKAYELAIFFKSTLDEKQQNKITNETIDEWTECFEKCHRLDGYSYEQIKDIVEYFRIKYDEENENGFSWAKNFQSPMKLRRLNKDKIRYIDYFWEQIKDMVEYGIQK